MFFGKMQLSAAENASEKEISMEKIEFIESYIKVRGGDYQWNDNHGELVRCHSCKHVNDCELAYGFEKNEDWYCADGERKDP